MAWQARYREILEGMRSLEKVMFRGSRTRSADACSQLKGTRSMDYLGPKLKKPSGRDSPKRVIHRNLAHYLLRLL